MLHIPDQLMPVDIVQIKVLPHLLVVMHEDLVDELAEGVRTYLIQTKAELQLWYKFFILAIFLAGNLAIFLVGIIFS